MGSSFFELNIATTGLFAAKAGLEVTSHNIANSGTPGFSRQFVKQRATTPLDKYGGVGQVGTGTQVFGVGQHRDVYLDRKYWSQRSTQGEFIQKSNQLGIAESIFSELSDSGIMKNVNSFFQTVSDLKYSSDDVNYRTAVINNADTLVSNIRNHATKLREQQKDLNDDIYSIIERVNAIGTQLASLNEQIYKFEIEGQTANELRDQRTLLLDELSKYVNVEVKEIPDGTGREEFGYKFAVLVNGQEFVNHVQPRKLECVRRGNNPLHPDDPPGLYDIKWSDGENLSLIGLEGELKGIIDMRDGDSGVGQGGSYKGIPYYVSKLNEFARTMARAFNEGKKLDGTVLPGVIGHENGFDLNGDKGGLFFSMTQADGTTATQIGNYNDVTAFNFAVSDELKKDPTKLATSDTNDKNQPSNNKVIEGFLKLKDDVSFFSEGGATQFINTIASTLAIDKKQADSFSRYYKDVVASVENQRMQVSGVSLNEEVANVVKYQHLYQTASKLINVLNDIYNTTINGLGI